MCAHWVLCPSCGRHSHSSMVEVQSIHFEFQGCGCEVALTFSLYVLPVLCDIWQWLFCELCSVALKSKVPVLFTALLWTGVIPKLTRLISDAIVCAMVAMYSPAGNEKTARLLFQLGSSFLIAFLLNPVTLNVSVICCCKVFVVLHQIQQKLFLTINKKDSELQKNK